MPKQNPLTFKSGPVANATAGKGPSPVETATENSKSLLDSEHFKGVAPTVIAFSLIAILGVMWSSYNKLSSVADYVRRAEAARVIERVNALERDVATLDENQTQLADDMQSLSDFAQKIPSRQENDLQKKRLEQELSSISERLARFESRVEQRFDNLESRFQRQNR